MHSAKASLSLRYSAARYHRLFARDRITSLTAIQVIVRIRLALDAGLGRSHGLGSSLAAAVRWVHKNSVLILSCEYVIEAITAVPPCDKGRDTTPAQPRQRRCLRGAAEERALVLELG